MDFFTLFPSYFQLGFSHITDLGGYDHILFLVALCAIYQLKEWKKVAVLVTAFTVGHCVTLILASRGLIGFSQAWIEFLIAVSILLTALYNILFFQQDSTSTQLWASSNRITYGITLLFGLIHGMGFSNYFRMSLFPGEEHLLVSQLLAFNIGVELGQLLIVGIILVLSYLVLDILKLKQKIWVYLVSIGAAIPALLMVVERMADL